VPPFFSLPRQAGQAAVGLGRAGRGSAGMGWTGQGRQGMECYDRAS